MIICTYNRSALLADLLQTVCAQTLPHAEYEIIVVDNNSSDETATVAQAYVARYPNVRYVMERPQGLSHARNRGWQAAKGEYVAYLDDDCKAPSHWLQTAAEIIRTVAPLVFGGPYFATYNSRKPAWFKDEYGSYAPCPVATFINETPDRLHGGNLFIARTLLAQIGGFDVTFGMSGYKQAYGEETALLRSLRTTVPTTTFYYDPALWVYHLVRPEKMALRWQMQAHFSKGRAIARLYASPQGQRRTRSAALLRIAGLLLLIVVSLLKGLFLRNRKNLPHLANFVYERILPQVTRLGQNYEVACGAALSQPVLTGYAKQTAAPLSVATQPCVSVLVAAWNEAAYLPNFLDSYGALTYPHKELILCVGGSDQSYDLAQQWRGATITLLAQQQGEGKYCALQRGLQQAKGTIIYLTDADCVLDEASFQQLLAPIIAGQETVVTGSFRPLNAQLGQPFVVAQWMMEQGEQVQATTQPPGQPIYTPYLVGANCALARSTLVAGWRNALTNAIGEDYYLALQVQRMGQEIRFCPESSIQTRYPVCVGDYILRKSRWHRSWLLHHYQLGDRRWLRNCLSACRFQLLLALPLLPLFLGLPGVALWVLVWAWCFAEYRRRQALFAASAQADITQTDLATVRLHHLLLLMIADFCAWAIIPFQLIVPRWRKQW